MDRFFVIVGSLFMMVGVGAGAFGAHGLSPYFERYPALEATFETAVRYHMIHALALLAVAWVSTRYVPTLANWSGYLFILGILLFSGSLYLLVFTRVSWLGAITPLGGAAFIAGWLLLALSAWRS